MEKEYTLYDLWLLFKKYFIWILNMTLIGASLSAVVVMLFVEPQYTSQAQLIVNQNSNQETYLQYNEIQTNVTLISTYRDIILGEGVLTEVNKNLNDQFSIADLRNSIEIEQSTDSQAFSISVTMNSPKDAQNIVNNLITEFEKTLVSIYGDEVSNVYIVSSASYNPSPVSPNILLFTIIGGVAGALIMIGIAFIIELMDNRIKSSDDLLELKMIRLGEIYVLSDEQREKTRYHGTTTNESVRKRV